MKKFHIAISTNNVEQTVADYSVRFGMKPCFFVVGEYALWRTETLNVSIRQDSSSAPGTLRHLGWEDDSATAFKQETDVNGIVWERFNALQQADEVNNIWPKTHYVPDK